MRELVTSKMTKVLSECIILRPCNNGLNVITIAMLENVFFHWNVQARRIPEKKGIGAPSY